MISTPSQKMDLFIYEYERLMEWEKETENVLEKCLWLKDCNQDFLIEYYWQQMREGKTREEEASALRTLFQQEEEYLKKFNFLLDEGLGKREKMFLVEKNRKDFDCLREILIKMQQAECNFQRARFVKSLLQLDWCALFVYL